MSSLIESGEYYGIKILRDGAWLHRDSPIARLNLVKLFAGAPGQERRLA